MILYRILDCLLNHTVFIVSSWKGTRLMFLPFKHSPFLFYGVMVCKIGNAKHHKSNNKPLGT